MLTRVLTSVIGIPVVIAIIIWGNPWLCYTMLIVSLIALYEFYHVIQAKNQPLTYIGYVAVIIQYLFLNTIIENYFLFITISTMISLIILVLCYPKYSIIDIGLTLFPVFYVGLLFSFIVLIREIKEGAFWIWLIPLSAWGCDTFAYFAGKTMGKHKLAPVLSPKKTIEGSIGGVVGVAVLTAIYTMIYTHYSAFNMRNQLFFVIIATVLSAIISQFGDLAASAVKRFYNQKDYGHILPGHGGILDRFDSFLFVSPIIYCIAQIVENRIG